MARVCKHILFRRDLFLAVAPPDENALLHQSPFEALNKSQGVVTAREPFIHLAYPTLAKYVRKTLWYYSIHDARGRFATGATPNLRDLVVLPAYRFIRSYFFHLGFMDGVEGFIMSVVWAVFGFLVTAHLYDLQAGRYENESMANQLKHRMFNGNNL